MRVPRRGWLYLFLWGVLIVAGIVAKRRYDHPNWMVFFHGPAAVFLVLAFYRLSAPFRQVRERELRWAARSFHDVLPEPTRSGPEAQT